MSDAPLRFALMGAAGYVAPRHLQAIRDTGNELVVAMDPHDSVGVLDRYFPEASFFSEFERFDRHLERLRRTEPERRVQYVSICSPNYLHDAHVRLALRVRAHAICEKPLVINSWNLDQLAQLEEEFGQRVYTVLQLREHPALLALKEELAQPMPRGRSDVVLTYVTRRGPWYQVSWKGSPEKSGGLAMNLGVHLFDLLLWLFGSVEDCVLHLRQPERMAGTLELEQARVRWCLSVVGDDLPSEVRSKGQSAWRSLVVDGREVDFSSGFEDLHTRVYEGILAGRGLGIEQARPSIDLLHRIRSCEVTSQGAKHPVLHD